MAGMMVARDLSNVVTTSAHLRNIAAQEFVDLLCGFLAVSDRIDDQAGTESDIASGENPRRGGHQRVRIDLERALACGFNAVIRLQERKIGRLSDRQNHGVARDYEFRSRLKFRVESLVFIKDGNALDDLQPG